MAYKFQKLTPERNMELGIYEDAIEYAFSESDIHNIAISGAYGAGKSSVIETYEERHKEKKVKGNGRRFMHISLAHFEDVENEIVDEENQGNKTEIRLEGKILNQLIHQIDPSKIPLTDFKVKSVADETHLWEYTWWIAAFVGLLHFIVFNDSWSKLLTSVCEDNVITQFVVSDSGKLFEIMALGAIGIKAIYTLLKLQTERRLLKKFTIQGNEFEILGDCQDSYFDRYLNEVLYLFENVDVDAIVFEDIDRFGSNQIFEKLREINILLAKRDKSLKFFFLLRDDIFETTDRTKFFDFIIPVVPVIDGSNSYNMCLEFLEEAGMKNLFSEEFLEGLTLFIDDMRLLKNILNEFQIYYGRFRMKEIGLNWNKLLAIITYKNIFPKDFGELQIRQGYVYALFAQKEEFRRKAVTSLKQEISELQLKIKELDDELCDNLKELDALYFMPDRRLRVDGKEVSQFASKAAFIDTIKNNQDKVQYYDERYGSPWRNYNPVPLFENYQNSKEYKERREKLNHRAQNYKLKYQQEIFKRERYINQIETELLQNLITNKNSDEVFAVKYTNPLNEEKEFEEIKRSPYFELIQYLIKEGYIDESYPDYMTYFYENSISAEDKKFLRAVLGRNPLPFNYQLRNSELVISKLKEHYFEDFEVLNFDIMDTLLNSSIKYERKLKRCIGQLCRFEEEGFIQSYLIRGNNSRNFACRMNENSVEMSEYVLGGSLHENVKVQYMIDTLCTSSNAAVVQNNYNDTLKMFVEDNVATIEILEEDASKVLQGMQQLNAKINGIDLEKVNQTLFVQIYKENMYKLNKEIIEAILQVFYGYESDKIDWSLNLTQIFSDTDQPLRDYVEDNLEIYIKVILAESNTVNDEEAVFLLVLNNEVVEIDDKKEYIRKYQGKINSLEAVEDKILWPELLNHNVPLENVRNMCDYYFNSDNQLDEYLIRFINESKEVLNVEDIEIDELYGEGASSKLFKSLITCEEIYDKKYEELIPSFHKVYDNFWYEELSNSKMRILLDKRIIRMTEKNLENIRDLYPSCLECFILHNIDEYINIMENEEMYNDEEFVLLVENYSMQNKDTKQRIIELASKHVSSIEKETKELNVQFLKAFIVHADVLTKTRNLVLVKQLGYMTKAKAKECLQIAGMQEFMSIFDGERPSLEATEDNKLFLDGLVENRLISSYIDDPREEGYYKIFGKTKFSNGKQRVYEVAKEMKMTNKELLNILKSGGSELTNHMSIMTEKEYAIVSKALGGYA